jgi:threonine synthase
MAFKDVGARVQARLLHTSLTGRRDDSGRHVEETPEAPWHRRSIGAGTRVFVLYPEGQVSDVQEAQMASLGDNVSAVAMRGTFDDCQRLVKQRLRTTRLGSTYG